MKIGFDASRILTLQRTGTENYSFYLAQHLAKKDRKNLYTLYFRRSPNRKELESIIQKNPNFRVKVIPWPRLWTQGGLAWECLRHPLDLLFVPAHTLPVIRRSSLKSVVTIHDLGFEYLSEYHQFPQKLYLDKATKFAARYATQLIAVSRATKRDLIKRFDVPEEKITVVYEGVDQEKFKVQSSKLKTEEVKRKYDIRGDYILFVGTIQPRKNLRRLVEAFSKIANKDLELVIVGRPGWMFEEIYSAPHDFGVEERVKFLGHVEDEDLADLYRGASCFVLPSLYEGFGLPVLEAMASGIPVVTSCTSSLPEVGGDAAVYVDPYKVSSISAGLAGVIGGSEGFRRSLTRKGFRQVEKFSWEKCAQETLAVFEKVAGESATVGNL